MDVAVSSKLKDVGYAGPLDEAMKPSQVRSAIERVKKQLMRKWKQKGGYENFGQKELSKMKDKFDYNPYGSSDERQISKMLDGFDNWAMNYDGSMRENEKYRQLYYTNESTGFDSRTGLFYLSGVPFTRERFVKVISFFKLIPNIKSSVKQFEFIPSLIVKDKTGKEEVLIDSKKFKMLVDFYRKNSAKLASDKDF